MGLVPAPRTLALPSVLLGGLRGLALSTWQLALSRTAKCQLLNANCLTTEDTEEHREIRCVHQQGFLKALIKIYSLVDCPIYSVVKYRPRGELSAVSFQPSAKNLRLWHPLTRLSGLGFY